MSEPDARLRPRTAARCVRVVATLIVLVAVLAGVGASAAAAVFLLVTQAFTG